MPVFYRLARLDKVKRRLDIRTQGSAGLFAPGRLLWISTAHRITQIPMQGATFFGVQAAAFGGFLACVVRRRQNTTQRVRLSVVRCALLDSGARIGDARCTNQAKCQGSDNQAPTAVQQGDRLSGEFRFHRLFFRARRRPHIASYMGRNIRQTAPSQ